MCGISGLVSPVSKHHQVFSLSAKKLLMHRGPDSFGSVSYKTHGVTLAHNRLNIVDNNLDSNQPFGDSNSSLIFNGEIYNYKDLRSSLLRRHSHVNFATDSDTEVLYKGLSLCGPSFISELDGMYAAAYFDSMSGRLYLFSDGFGIKQIYYILHDNVLIFGSEFEFVSLVAKQFGLPLSLHPLAFDYCYSYLSPPVGVTLFSEVKRLVPGLLHTHHLDHSRSITPPSLKSYSCLGIKCLSQQRIKDSGRLGNILNNLCEGMHSFAKQGLLCSGGVDSTVIAIAASSKSNATEKVPLLVAKYASSSEGFVSDFPYAEQVSYRLDMPMLVSAMPSLTLESFLELSDIMSCCGDITAALPLLQLARIASSRGVRVLFTGLGADEIFLGYRQHQLLSLFSILPLWLRRLAAIAFSFLDNTLPLSLALSRRIRRASIGLCMDPVDSTIVSMEWGSSTRELFDEFKAELLKTLDSLHSSKQPPLAQARLLFFIHFLASSHLPPSDSISMKPSVELRPVFLTKSIFRRHLKDFSLFSLFLPKISLKRIIMTQFSPKFVFRPKSGFGIEASSLDPDLLAFLLELVVSSNLVSVALRDRVVSDISSNSWGSNSRSLYGLLSLVHAIRLTERILVTQ